MNRKALLLLFGFLIVALTLVPVAAAETTVKDRLVTLFSFSWINNTNAAVALAKGLIWGLIFVMINAATSRLNAAGAGGGTSSFFTGGASALIAGLVATGAVAFLPADLLLTWFAGFEAIIYAVMLLFLVLLGWLIGWKMLPGMGVTGRVLGLFQLILVFALLGAYENIASALLQSHGIGVFRFVG